jgi:hypothetical protein
VSANSKEKLPFLFEFRYRRKAKNFPFVAKIKDAGGKRHSGDQQGVAAGLSVPPSKPLGRNERSPAGSRFFVRAVSRLRVVSQFEILTALARVGAACYA